MKIRASAVVKAQVLLAATRMTLATNVMQDARNKCCQGTCANLAAISSLGEANEAASGQQKAAAACTALEFRQLSGCFSG